MSIIDQVHKIVVNGDDPRWMRFEPNLYLGRTDLSIGDLLFQPGSWEVHYRLIGFDSPLVYEVLRDFNFRAFSQPNRVEAETIIDAWNNQPTVSMAGICPGSRGYPVFSSINGARFAEMRQSHERCWYTKYCIAIRSRQRLS